MLGSGVAGCKESQSTLIHGYHQVLSLEDRGEVALWSSLASPFSPAWVLQAQRRAWS